MSTLHRLLASLLVAALGLAAGPPSVQAQDPDPRDPFKSYAWIDMHKVFLAGATVRFDERVRVQGPSFAEDPMNVPISVEVSPELGPVERVLVLVDRNPIRQVLEYQPLKALPAIGFRFKLEQASPVRAAVRLRDGSWVVGSTWVDSTGGGCTVSGATRKDGTWSRTLGEVSGRVFERAAASAAGSSRLRVQIMHPMDTGLVAGVPAFYVNRLSVRDAQGTELARMLTWEPVSENPVFSFDFPQPLAGGGQLTGTDNNGNRITSRVQ